MKRATTATRSQRGFILTLVGPFEFERERGRPLNLQKRQVCDTFEVGKLYFK